MEGNYELAASLAHKYRREGIVDEKFEALEATLDVLTHKSDRALQKFSELLDQIDSSRPFMNSEYIRLYCRFYIALIQREDSLQPLSLIHETQSTKYIRKVLPVPRDAAEFEAVSDEFFRSAHGETPVLHSGEPQGGSMS